MVIKLNNVRLSFPQIWTPKAFKSDQTPSFSATFLLHKKDNAKDIKALKVALGETADDKWPSGRPGALKICLHEGSEKDHIDGYTSDILYIGTGAKMSDRPRIFDKDMSEIDPMQQSKVYAGCYVNALITLWAQDNEWGKRVNAQLDAIQLVRDGPAFGAPRVDPTKHFAPLEDDGQSIDKDDDSERMLF